MNKFVNFRARVASLKLLRFVVMSKNNEKVYYAVGRGREIGIYNTWKDCKVQTEGIPNAKYRKFFSLDEAEEFVNFWKNYSPPVKESNELQNSAGSVGDTCEDSKELHKAEAGGEKLGSGQDEAAPNVPHIYLQPPSSPHSTSLDGRTEPRNVDVLALNLRLDSFEKRFDACLKEVGAIVSELSHIRSEVKEIKEKLPVGLSSGLSPGSGYSPRKAKDGMLQTTLAFGSAATTPSNSYSTHQYSTDSGEFKPRRGKTLKRKLSKSNSCEGSKRFADDGNDNDDDDDDENLASRINTDAVAYTSFTRDEDDYVEVYTDGASHCNGNDNAKAGIGIWWGDGHPLNVGEPVAGPPTNNTAEIQAARVAMELAVKCGLKRVKILTDSEFLINCATRWIHRWKKNGWVLVNGGPVKNRKELEKLDKVARKLSVRWEKVAGHAGVKGNEMADRLANEGALRYNR